MTKGETLLTPQFGSDERGRPIVVLDRASYIALLVRANITDPAFWLPGTEQGAQALARLRQIETDCIAQHGEFDWEKLSPETRDEYDALCALLDDLMDTGERIALEDDAAKTITITRIGHRRDVYEG
jgi:hypothetical protein